MDKPVKSGKEILDDFFNNLLNVQNVDKKLGAELKKMYEEGEFSGANLSNKLDSLREEEINDKN